MMKLDVTPTGSFCRTAHKDPRYVDDPITLPLLYCYTLSTDTAITYYAE